MFQRLSAKYAVLCTTYIVSLFIVIALPSQVTAAETAAEFAAICAKVAASAPGSEGRLHFEPNFENGRCWGAFAAAQALSRIKSATDKPPLLGICTPEESTRLELVKVFVDYVNTHPESRTQDFAVVMIIALRSRYPCPASD